MVGESRAAAADKPRAIFRPEALQRYMQGRERLILPRYTAQSTAAWMWTIVILLAVGAFAIGVTPVPIVTSATAVIDTSGERAVVFLAPETLSLLRPGQTVRLWLRANAAPATHPIERIEPRLVSPADARRRYQLDDASAGAITRAAAVVTVRLQAPGDRDAYAGSVVPAAVQTGVERVVSRLSGLGRGRGE